MNQLVTLLLLALFHFLTGYGLLYFFKLRLKALPHIALAVIMGIMVVSLIPFLMQLFYIPITALSVYLTWALFTVALNIRPLVDIVRKKFKWTRPAFRFRIYEIPAICMLAFILFVSAWRCYYYPTYARDTMSGPETIAEYTIREHTMINSVFSVNLESTNNQFKSPFLTDLQIVYKFAGFPFGGVWLILLVASFYIFLYYALSEKLHPVLTGLLLLCFIATPEPYGYTFMFLYDYPNMVLLFLGCYFLFTYFGSRQRNQFYYAVLLMAMAVYIRSETLVLIGMATPLILYSSTRAKEGWKKSLVPIGILLLACLVAYVVPGQLYNNHYLPQTYELDSLVNQHLGDLDPLFQRFSDMNNQLLFGEWGSQLWGNFIYLFLILFAAELVIKRKVTREAGNWLIAVLIIYLGLPLLGFLLPLMDLNNTTKRGLFKLLPLMLLYMGNNQLLTGLSRIFYKWEGDPRFTEPVAVAPAKGKGKEKK